MGVDLRIHYRLALAGVPIRWRTRISAYARGERFVDTQERGPFARWEHEHRFLVTDHGVHMLDRVVYQLPLGRLGAWLAGIPVAAALSAIFDHRYRAIAAHFADEGPRALPQPAEARAAR